MVRHTSVLTGPSRFALIAGTILFAVLGLSAGAVAIKSVRQVVADWNSDSVAVGAGAIVALPWMALFIFALAFATARSISRRARPSELMGRGTAILGGITLIAVAVASLFGVAVANRLEADGYSRCDRGFTGRLGIVHWVRGNARCPNSKVSA